MKFGYRDRIILLVVCVIIIFGVGIVVFIKPKYEKLQADKKARDQAVTDWNIQLDHFNAINTRQETIERNFTKANDVAANFTDEMDAVALDTFLREKFANTEKNIEDGMKLTSTLAVSDEGTASISYYYYTPSIVTYSLYEAADMDGSLAEAAAEKRKESDVLSQRAAQTVGASLSNFTITVNREDVMALLDAVHDYAVKNKDAMLVNTVAITDYKFQGGLTPEEGQPAQTTPPAEGEEGEAQTPTQQTAGTNEEQAGTSDVAITYTVYYMQEPKKPELGPKYDPTVWDTDAWRTYVSAETPAE